MSRVLFTVRNLSVFCRLMHSISVGEEPAATHKLTLQNDFQHAIVTLDTAMQRSEESIFASASLSRAPIEFVTGPSSPLLSCAKR